MVEHKKEPVALTAAPLATSAPVIGKPDLAVSLMAEIDHNGGANDGQATPHCT